jgi:hypothetical protein
MLFTIVADMLAIMIEHAKIEGQIEGLITHLVDGVSQSFNTSTTQSCLWNTTWKKLEI